MCRRGSQIFRQQIGSKDSILGTWIPVTQFHHFPTVRLRCTGFPEEIEMKITTAALVSNCFTPSNTFRRRKWKRPEARLLTWACSSFSWWWSCLEQVLTYMWITVMNGFLWSRAPHSFTYRPPTFTEQEIPLNVRAALTTCWGRIAVLLLSLSLPPSIWQPELCPALALCAAFQQDLGDPPSSTVISLRVLQSMGLGVL